MQNIFSLTSRFLCVLVITAACSPMLRAQNVRIGNEDKGAAYTIEAGVTNQTMTFTEAGAKATASSDATWNGQINVRTLGTIDIATGSVLTVGGGIIGDGKLTKSSGGTLLLNSASTQTGATVIENGTFRAGKNKVFSAGSDFSMDDGVLDLNDTVQEIASLSGNGNVTFGTNGTGELTVGGNDSDTTFSGTFSDRGTLIKTGTGTLFLTGSGTTDAFEFDIRAGTLAVNDRFSAAGSTATVRETGTLGGTGSLYDVVVENGGTLAPGNRTGYEVLATDTLTLENDLTLESGSTLSIRVDEAGNSDQVIVNGTYADTSGEARLEIVALAGRYAAEETYDRFLVDGAGANLANFGAANIFLKQKFLELVDTAEAPDAFKIARIDDYFSDRARTRNQRGIAAIFDRTAAPSLWKAMTNIAASTDQAVIDDAYMELSGSIKANAHMLGQWQTSRYGLNHLDLGPCGRSRDGTLWLEFIHQTIDFDPDMNSRDYGISRTGVLIGAEENCGDWMFGMLGGYAKPYLYSHGDKYDVGDLVFGFYGGTKIVDTIETKLYIGFGSQSYHSKRFIRNALLIEDVPNNRVNGKFSGNSMSVSFEFALPIEMGQVSLRPLLAFDSDMSWQYGYAETGDTGFEMEFGRSFFDRTFIRTGFTAQLGSVRKCSPLALVGRFYYGYQIGGESYPVTPGRFIADPTAGLKIVGADPGKDYVNIGVGFRWNFDECRGFYGDYDYSALDRGTGHSGTIGFMQKW